MAQLPLLLIAVGLYAIAQREDTTPALAVLCFPLAVFFAVLALHQ